MCCLLEHLIQYVLEFELQICCQLFGVLICWNLLAIPLKQLVIVFTYTQNYQYFELFVARVLTMMCEYKMYQTMFDIFNSILCWIVLVTIMLYLYMHLYFNMKEIVCNINPPLQAKLLSYTKCIRGVTESYYLSQCFVSTSHCLYTWRFWPLLTFSICYTGRWFDKFKKKQSG